MSCYQTSDSTVYRNMSGELIVIQLDDGYFYYFNPCTEEFLDYFKKARSLKTYFEQSRAPQDPIEKNYLKEFCHSLLEKKILVEAATEESGTEPAQEYVKPVFLRKGEQTLDEIVFLCP